MTIDFPYRGFQPVHVSDDQLQGVYGPHQPEALPDTDTVIAHALAHPVGSAHIAESVRPADRVLVLTDDNTRLTPVDRILPFVLDELRRAGVSESRIEIMVAGGTHRHMTPAELDHKLGPAVTARFRILQNGWNDAAEIAEIGTTELGTPIAVNRRALDADYVIGIGHIVPHRVAGFSGGSKIIQPGICGWVTTGYTHWLSARFSGSQIMGRALNPVRSEMNDVAGRVGLSYLINAVQDGRGRLVALVAGDFLHAFAAGAEISKQVFRAPMPQRADIVITDSYPADIELWQAAKGVYTANLAVANGGVIILVTPCPEGVSVQHRSDILRFGYGPYDTVRTAVEDGELTNLAVAAHLVHGGESMGRGVTVMLVSTGISELEAERLNFLYASTVADALTVARGIVGASADIAVLQHGGELLPEVTSTTDRNV